MGALKQQMIEEEDELLIFESEQELDFDLRDADSEDWWLEQDKQMTAEEEKQIELMAEIVSLRIGGLL
jgi:hypothetical protein